MKLVRSGLHSDGPNVTSHSMLLRSNVDRGQHAIFLPFLAIQCEADFIVNEPFSSIPSKYVPIKRRAAQSPLLTLYRFFTA